MLEMTGPKMKAFHVELLGMGSRPCLSTGHACENGCSGGFPLIIGLIPKMTKDCGYAQRERERERNTHTHMYVYIYIYTR